MRRPWRLWAVAWLGILALARAAEEEGQDKNETANKTTKGGSKKCLGAYRGGVVNLCPQHWPDKNAEKIWLVLFYAPWCGHCRALQPKYVNLSKELRNETPSIGIGAVDCNEVPNQGLCSTHGVRGYPTMRAIVAGKIKPYHGARELKAMKSWILDVHEARGTKGGSKVCPVGIFRSKVRDAVVPLCEAHFPKENAKNPWIVIFYDENSPNTDFRDGANQAAIDLGSEPPDRSKALKQEPQKRRDRAINLEEKYELSLDLPAKGPFGSESLAKIGGVCCDCSEESRGFCDKTLGERRNDELPLKVWVDRGEREVFDGADFDARPLVEFALQRLGLMEDPSKRVEL